jgi:hypothetical protein
MTPRTLALVMLVACRGGGGGAVPREPGSAPPATATPPPTTAAGGDASPAASPSVLITPGGVGPLNAATDPRAIAALFPGMIAKTEHAEAEDYSYDDTAISDRAGGGPELHVIVDRMRDERSIFRVDVVGPRFATAKDIRVGSSVGELAAAYPDASCTRATYSENPEGFDRALFCESKSLPNLWFHLDPDALKGPDGKVAIAKLAALKLNRILWRRPDQDRQ